MSDAFHVPLGTPIPDVTLPELDGHPVRVRNVGDGRPVLILWSANHCPEYEHVQTITDVREDVLHTDNLGSVRVFAVTTAKLPGDDLPTEHHLASPLVEQDWFDTDGRAHKLLMRWEESGPIGLVSRTNDFHPR